jgi:signal transduction histidine kinase
VHERLGELVTTDGGKLKTVVKNLVGNALKFTRRRGGGRRPRRRRLPRLAVRTRASASRPSTLPVIFEMFRQVDARRRAATAASASGSIVKRLVTLLGGTIDVDRRRRRLDLHGHRADRPATRSARPPA